MSKEKPDHHDAELMLRVYDLRRESLMRQSRAAVMGQFWPKRYEDLHEIASKADHPLNAPLRQVGTYWEMVYAMVRHGIVNPGYFLETNGEGLFLFAKVQPYLEQYRKDFVPTAYRNAEWVATESPEGRVSFESISARVKRMAAAR